MMSSFNEQKRWAEINGAAVSSGTAEMSSPWWLGSIEEQVCCSSDNQQYWSAADWRDKWWSNVTISFIVNASLTCFLRLGYLKPFLVGSKKTRQGPRLRVGALYISRCWFCLTVVAGQKEYKKITKLYRVVFCCVMVSDDLNAYAMWIMNW